MGAGYEPVLHSPEVGWTVAGRRRGGSTLVLAQGHPEYSGTILLREYRRDVSRYLDGTRPELPILPRRCIDGPKGAALLDVVHAPTRVQYPMARAPGSNELKRISWDDALNRIARHMKDDRDKNFVAKNAAGTTVNRWLTTGMLAASASSNETALLTWKVVRSFGMVVFDNQARV